jgi:hypothetical protein
MIRYTKHIMKYLLKIEYLALLIATLVAYHLTNGNWLVFALCFFLPDVGMIGYLYNTRIGSITYNIFHHLSIPVALELTGMLLDQPALTTAALIMFSHICFDRMLGYGLKYPDRFQHTHLHRI